MDEQNLHLPLMIIRLFQSVAITDSVAVNNPVNMSFLKSASIPEGWSHEEEYWWEWPKCTPEHSRQSFPSPAMCEQACFPTHTSSVPYQVFFSFAILMANALICISLVMSIIEHLKNTLKNLFCKLLVLSFARFSIGLLVNGILKVRVNWIVGRKSSFFFLRFFLMWTILEVFIVFVTTNTIFWFRFFWPRGIWYLSSLIKDQTGNSCTGSWTLNRWPTREVPWNIF